MTSNIYRHRALAEILVGRELKARYRGTALGFLWSFANPLLMMCIYVLVFRVYMRIDVPNYPAFVMCGLLPWVAFSQGLTEGMGAIIANGGIIRKIYLPTQIFPFVSVAHTMVHFALSLPVLLGIIVLSHMHLTPALLLLPVLFLAQFAFTYALALMLASLAVQFRDLMHIVPNLLLVWFYLTPVFYATHMVPERYRALVYLNPLSWLIEAYRDIFYHGRLPAPAWVGAFGGLSLLLLALGARLFESRRDLYPELV